MLQGAVAGVDGGLELRLGAGQHLDVRLRVLRQHTHVLLLKLAEFGFLLHQGGGGCLQLGIQKLSGALGLLLAGADVLIDEERSQLGVDLLRDHGPAGGVGDLERSQFLRPGPRARRFHQVDLNVLTHGRDLIVGGWRQKTLIQMQVVDDRQQTGAAQDLLGDRLQALAQIHLHIWQDIVLGNLGLLDQDHRLRGVLRGYDPRRQKHQKPSDKQRSNDPPFPAGHNGPVIIYSSQWFLIIKFFHMLYRPRGCFQL